MNKLIKIVPVMLIAITFMACGGSDDGGSAPPTPNTAPTAVSNLIYPSSDLLCIDTNIEFEWAAATDADNDNLEYTIRVATDRDQTNIVAQQTTSNTSVLITLNPGIAYYWNVVASDGEDEAEASPTLAFYTEGEGVSNYVPFAASIIAPEMDAFLDSGSVSLQWSGSDVDVDDTLTYDVFFGTTDTPDLLQSDVTATTLDVTTVAGTTYYWKIDTKDNNGTKSIGQVWTFTTN
ncbi:hypothetical protein JAO71_12355 [Olleya sp. YSTF-M6]|uniref:Fibronectin type-III domain-containing protein n=1 Tax=Olleya sediminilitoris TaxID=2795739 RepID=A0ABS1WN79_9FLAO|nr:hypothetical protein [Olleya sediminilitoris]MBL7560591.1 hypothetical protein [Olleya sediminilitoris]